MSGRERGKQALRPARAVRGPRGLPSARGLRIGLVYDLRDDYLAEGWSEEETAEFDSRETVEAIEATLVRLGHRPERVGHAKRLVARLAAGDRWDLVFNIAEGLHGLGREAVVPALLDLYQIPYTFSDPLVMTVSLHKATTKRVLRDAGLPTPGFALVETLADAARVKLAPPLFVKPVAEGTSKGISSASVVRSTADLEAACAALLARFQQPVLVEELLPGRELTVGVVGTGDAAEVLGSLEVVLLPGAEPGVYSYANKEHCEDLVRYEVPRAADDPMVAAAEALALAAWRALGCRDAGRVDLRCDVAGRPQIIEVNPLAGLHPTHSDLPILATALGIPYLALLERIMRSATARLPASPAEVRERAAAG